VEARARLVFVGRVQGVYFRANTQRVAREEGLTGWVRNRRDGSVEAVVEGGRAAIERAVERLKVEVSDARVDRVEAQWSAATGEFEGFEVRA
jgi:acylphosphatase